MADMTTIKGRIAETIYPNGKGAITAESHQALLLEMVDDINAKKADKEEVTFVDEKVTILANETESSVQNLQDELTELSVETTTLQPTGIIDVTHLFMPKATYAGEFNSGVFAPVINNEGKYCALFRVKQGTTFEVSGLVGANSARAWFKYNNKGKIISKSEANISVNETLIMDHEGYIVFNHYGNPTDVFSVKTDAEILPLNTTIGLCNIKKDTEVITQNIQALEENTSSKIDAIRNEVQSNSISTQLVNLLNPNDVIDFQILDSNGGGIHSNNGYWTSGFIEVENGVTYATNIKSIRRYALYDEDKVWISGGDNVNEIAASSNGFVRFSVEKSVDSRQPNEVGFGVKGTDYSVEYGAFEVSVKGERLALYSDLPNIALEKKSIAIIGDSAVQASNWASNMGANLGFARCDIYAVGGYTWRNNYQDGALVNCVGVLLNRMIATNIKYDVILFQIGGNDITTWQPEVYGSVENALSEYNYKGYANATTTAECVRYYLSMIREMYPSSLILVGTPFQRMKSEGNAEDVADILRKICAALCIQTIDGCKELGFSQLTECTTPYYNDGNMGVANNRTGLSRSNPIYNYIEDATGNIVDYTTATNDGILKSGYSKKYGIYTYDGKHQNAEGERKVLEYMTAKLKTFVE